MKYVKLIMYYIIFSFIFVGVLLVVVIGGILRPIEMLINACLNGLVKVINWMEDLDNKMKKELL